MASLLYMVADSASPNANEARVQTALEVRHTVTLISDDATSGASDLSAYDAGVISDNASGTYASNWDLATAGVLVGKSSEANDYGLSGATVGALTSDTQVEAEGTGAVVTDLSWTDGTDYTIFDGARTPATLLVSELPAGAEVVALDNDTALEAYAVTYASGGAKVGGGTLDGRRAWIGGNTDKRGSTSGDDTLWGSLAAFVAGEIPAAAAAGGFPLVGGVGLVGVPNG